MSMHFLLLVLTIITFIFNLFFPFCRNEWLLLSLHIITFISCSSGYATVVLKREIVASVITLLESPHLEVAHIAFQTLENVSLAYTMNELTDHVIGEELMDCLLNLTDSKMPVNIRTDK